MSIKIENKYPTTEEEKQNMKQPYVVDKCSLKLAIFYLESILKSARIIGIVHVGCPKINLSAMDLTKELHLAQSSLLQIKKPSRSVSAATQKINLSVMELISSWSFEND